MLTVAITTGVFLATFLAAAIAVVMAWAVLQRRRAAGEATQAAVDLPDPEETPLLLKQDVLSTVSPWAYLLALFDFVQDMKTRIAEADLTWSVGRLTAMMLLSGTMALAGLLRLEWVPGPVAAGASLLAALLPYLYVLWRRAKRFQQFEEQFPEALDYLSRAMRAGHPLAVSLEMLVAESFPPLSVEMRKTSDERNLGMAWDQALQDLARRVPLMDVRVFAAAVHLQSRTGGKLSDVLGRLAETMRERASLRGEIRSLSAHGRLTGMVLTLIPLAVMAVMAVTNPAYLQILFQHPRGRDLLTAAAVCLILAHFVIRRIVSIRI